MNALVIGYGRMGKLHAKVLFDLGHTVTTVDPDPKSGSAIPSYDSSTDPRPQIVCIATPIHTLAHQAAKWIGHDGWLLVEKPMATNTHVARALAHTLRNQRVAVGYVERYNPVVKAMKADTTWRRDLPVKFTRINTRPSANVTLDLATHDADLSRYLGAPTATFHTQAGVGRQPVRRIEAQTQYGSVTYDLTRHQESPLHTMWRDFLWGAEGSRYARPEDAVKALEKVRDATASRNPAGRSRNLGRCDCDNCLCG